MTDQPRATPRFRLPIVLALAVAFVLGVGASLVMERSRSQVPEIEGLLWPEPRSVGPFELADQRGNPFGQEQLRGRWSLLFFGYTHCPDVCPVTLAVLADVAARLEEQGADRDLQVAMVSVDPERDALPKLGQYVEFFDPSFLGVTGPEPRLRELTTQLGVIAIRTEADADGSYLVDHTAAVLLIDPQARLVGLFRVPHEPADIADRVARIRRFVES